MTQELYQNDPRWKDTVLGHGAAETIGMYGCLLTSLAMVANHFGGNETVATFNDKMKQNNGFMNQWIKPALISAVYPNVKYQKRVQCENQPAPLTEIDAGLAAGSLVVVMIDRSPSAGIQGHWIVLHAKVGDDDYAIWDPWNTPGAAKTLHGRYGHGAPADIIQDVIWFGGGTLKLPQATEEAKPSAPAPAAKPKVKADVVTPNVDGLKMRSQPQIAAGNIVKQLSRSNKLKILEEADKAKVGQHDQWLHVRDIEGDEGYVAAWYVTPTDDPFLGVVKKDEEEAGEKPTPPSKLVVKTTTEGVAFRTQPRIGDDTLIERLPLASELVVTDAGAEGKIGTHGEWLQVQDLDGDKGYVAAWYVVLAESTASPSAPPASKPAATGGKQLKVNFASGLKMRSEPEPTSETVIGQVANQTVVEAIGEPHKYDDRFTFQKVRTPDGKEGWLTYKDGTTTYLVEVKEEKE